MKTLNKTLITTAVAMTLALSAGTTFAKGGQGFDQAANQGQQLEYIFAQLNLSDAQQEDVLELLEETREAQRQAMWDARKATRDSEDRPSREEMQAQREAMQTAQMQLITDKLNTVLSPEVTDELVDYLEAHQGQGMKGERGGKGNDQRPNAGQGNVRSK
jgi:flagellar biosynthesis GTPase FlhF